MSAAARLAEHGVSVTLYEAAHNFGGRARGIRWNGETLDNGQHILLGAYAETLSLLKLAGVDPEHVFIRQPLNLEVLPEFRLQVHPSLPAPLHILYGLLHADGLDWFARWKAIHFMGWMKLRKFNLKKDEPLLDLLERHGQSEKLIRYLWEPICLAALNTPLNRASAQIFLNVLRDSFSNLKSDSDALLPKLDLSTLFADPLVSYIIEKGGVVRKEARVLSISHHEKRYEISTQRGDKEYFSEVILAVSPFRVADLTGNLPELTPQSTLCKMFQYQPICTAYLQYDPLVSLPQAMYGLSIGLGQWVFDRGHLYSQPGLLAVVISTKGDHLKLDHDTLAKTLCLELATAFPELAAELEKPVWYKIVTEKRATFACEAGLNRPSVRTKLKGFYLAGDYVEGDYPATIEGAVLSGSLAARAILQDL